MIQSVEESLFIERLPKHLKQFIISQNYEEYTSINQAVWRYVMRKNTSYLTEIAHETYLDGLEKTGISIESIPSIYEMNLILKKIGWLAVAVDGFIPPNAFMEFQSYKILVIATDIRQLENIEYTPSPDIIHEAAGHAPIIANPDYAEYLRRLGDIGAKAILSNHDNKMYEAIRELSILKEASSSSENDIENAEKVVKNLQNTKVELSEMAQLRNLQWWSVEYGLIGDLENFKVYGAGLLSSIGESEWCMTDNVKKNSYSIDTANVEFDITKPQPQLFVTPDFSYLMQVLEEFANTMALRKGGALGIEKLINSRMVGSIELTTGLQVSGKFCRFISNDENEVVYFKTEGATALSYRDKELIGHGVKNHADGFGSPIGKLKNINLSIEDMGPLDLKAYNFYDGKRITFEFESGIKVEGLNVTGLRSTYGKLLLIQFEDCTVTYGNEFLFKPEYGTFDMAIGKEVISAYAGAADSNSFPNLYHESNLKTVKTTKSKSLELLYQKVREFRVEKNTDQSILDNVFMEIYNNHNNDWLLSLEILELSKHEKLRNKVVNHLENLIDAQPKLKTLIKDGIIHINTNNVLCVNQSLPISCQEGIFQKCN